MELNLYLATQNWSRKSTSPPNPEFFSNGQNSDGHNHNSNEQYAIET